MAIVVWEWQNELNIYLPYSTLVSAQLETARINNVKDVKLGQIDPYLETFEVNIPMMKQKTTYNGKTREVRRVFIDSSHPFARGSKWEWNFKHDHWFPYNTEVSKKIQECADAGGTAPLQLPSLLPGYSIDIRTMTQTNTTTGFQRKIRCVTCPPYHNPTLSSNPTRSLQQASLPQQAARQRTSMLSSSQRVPNFPGTIPAPQPALQPAAVTQSRQISSSQPPANISRLPRRPAPTAAAAYLNPQAVSSSNASRAGASSSNASRAGASSSNVSGAGASSSSQGTSLSDTLQSLVRSSCTPYSQVGATQDVCPVCQNNMTDSSDYTTHPGLAGLQHDRITLKCNHHIHTQCLHALISSSNNSTSFSCLECQRSYGVRTGNQPTSGKMAVKTDSSISLAGYEQYGTIIVTYNFTSGVGQNGVSYSAHGFPRTAYFPDCDDGNDVVDLIKVAFKRRLIFTIGDSVTTGAKNCVVWNDIHHKTSMRRGDTYGYPDPGYLARVRAELKSKGVE
ncbi:hypothetical protein ACHWQZ_G016886 [Mnemiopsis leidyi]